MWGYVVGCQSMINAIIGGIVFPFLLISFFEWLEKPNKKKEEEQRTAEIKKDFEAWRLKKRHSRPE